MYRNLMKFLSLFHRKFIRLRSQANLVVVNYNFVNATNLPRPSHEHVNKALT